jgi:hypothetical protein
MAPHRQGQNLPPQVTPVVNSTNAASNLYIINLLVERGMTREQAEAEVARLPPQQLPGVNMLSSVYILRLTDLLQSAGMSPAAADAAVMKVEDMLPPPIPYPDSTAFKKKADEYEAALEQVKVGMWCITGFMLLVVVIRLVNW